jgi:hypothetical protein
VSSNPEGWVSELSKILGFPTKGQKNVDAPKSRHNEVSLRVTGLYRLQAARIIRPADIDSDRARRRKRFESCQSRSPGESYSDVILRLASDGEAR